MAFFKNGEQKGKNSSCLGLVPVGRVRIGGKGIGE
jgi:hypothetical protein